MSTRERSTDPRLDRRPDASTMAVDELMAAVHDGKVRVPSFQRGMRWGDGERLKLFDSIFRGYPIGTPLFWKRKAPAAKLSLGALELYAAERSDALWVVDGQQRIITLAEALMREGLPGDRAMHFDLDRGEFLWARVPQPLLGLMPEPLLPVAVLLDSNKLLEWLFARRSVPAPSRAAAIEVGKRIREYRLPVYVVEAEDERVLRVIFDRVNSTGRGLTDAEVFHALFSSSTPATLTLKSVHERLKALGWGDIPLDAVVLRTLRAIEGLAPDDDLSKDLDEASAQNALEKTEHALVKAVTFMRDQASIPSHDFAPYSLPLIVLGRFFDAFPSPSPRSLILLRRWLWRGSLALQLTGAIVDQRRFVRCIRDGDEHGSVQSLLALVATAPDRSVFERAPVRFGTARTKMQCCALASLGPCDLRSGLSVATTLVAEAESPLVAVARDHAGIDARLLHPALAQAPLRAAILDADERSLHSQCIPDDAVKALARGDVDGFLNARWVAMQSLFARFFGRQAEWDADDSPPLDAILDGDDD